MNEKTKFWMDKADDEIRASKMLFEAEIYGWSLIIAKSMIYCSMKSLLCLNNSQFDENSTLKQLVEVGNFCIDQDLMELIEIFEEENLNYKSKINLNSILNKDFTSTNLVRLMELHKNIKDEIEFRITNGI